MVGVLVVSRIVQFLLFSLAPFAVVPIYLCPVSGIRFLCLRFFFYSSVYQDAFLRIFILVVCSFIICSSCFYGVSHDWSDTCFVDSSFSLLTYEIFLLCFILRNIALMSAMHIKIYSALQNFKMHKSTFRL